MKIPIEKQKIFISDFEKIRPVYEKFAVLLSQILQKAVDQLGYLAIVQVRAKKVVSFSNKIIMKDKYQNPLTDVTDLCGGRVIVHFQSQVAAVCEFIKNNFTIDEANSLDLKSRLKVNEFGYRSVHYIITPKKSTILGIPIEEEFRNLKAEIQVRTLAEHVWADISHDRLYKTDLTIPEEWKREAARLSAILENADNTFASMSQAIDSVSNVYELQYETDKAKINIERLETLVEINKTKPEEGIKNVISLISVYNALNLPEKAKLIIEEWIKIVSTDNYWKARLNFEDLMIDMSVCFGQISRSDYNRKTRKIKDLLEDLKRLHEENRIPGAHELSFLYFRYGSLLQNNLQKQDDALNAVRMALELMPDNPLYLTALAECMVLRNIDIAHHTITLFRNILEKNITELEELISLGIDAIPAWFAVGRCHFFLGNNNACIRAYTNAVSIILDKKYASSCFVVNSEISRMGRLLSFDNKLAEQVALFLNIAMTISDIAKDVTLFKSALEEAQLRTDPINKPVVIVAGGASLMDSSKVSSYREYIEELMLGFKGTIICGGTTSGIPGLTGLIALAMKNKKLTDCELLAYLPEKLPSGVTESPGYDYLYRTSSDEFSALDILTSWTDIILSGIHPSEVIIIGINGGEIADLEYRIGLSLGAKVCLISYSGRAVADLIQEKQWKGHPNLIQIPNDPFTLWAIVNQKTASVLSKEQIETLAPLVHEFYREKRVQELKPTETDVNKYRVIMRWKKLDPVLQYSNRLQVAFYEHILKRVNLGIRKSKNPKLFNIKEELKPELRDTLAKLEHARWNAERLLEGWRYGPQKDLARKLNPYLVAWENLDEDIKPYDYDPVDNIPLMLEKIGYEVYRIGNSAGKAPVSPSKK
jgi:ppGpp synthetase/RelA/SpoT-type nucleotidyltranferase